VTKKRKLEQEIETAPEPIAVETSEIRSLRSNLDDIKTDDGVIGYILRNSSSATIDLKDPTKVIDYAILSSCSLDASKEVSALFNLGETKSIFVEGKSINVLSLIVGESSISVFLEKNADWKTVLKKLC
jgi:predicted regulator of Ras-like GTPase activity (Roadblock/LC7/MglB family)